MQPSYDVPAYDYDDMMIWS